MRRRLSVISALAVTALLALAACGSAKSSGGTMTKAEYDAKLNRMCLLAADQFRELHMDNSLGDWKAFGPELAAIDRHFTNNLHPEKAPAPIASAARSYVKAHEKVVQADEAAIVAAKAGDRTKLHAAVERVNEDNLATYPPAKAIGATGCYFS
jgi:hypothetical protein